jgi:hypothetical protein
MRPAGWIVSPLAALVALSAAPDARAEELPVKHKAAVDRGLKWLRDDAKREGDSSYWAAANGDYAVSMTALAGMAFLMEGSTLKEGKYRREIRGAANWLMARVQSNGLIGNPSVHREGGRYMYGHGFGLLFLSCLVGEEDNAKRRRDLHMLLERAAKYSRDAQTKRGGWGYVSAKENENFDEGSVTITQVQALRAARNAGVVVPGDAIKDALAYLKESTGSDGGVRYSLARGYGGEGRPALTAAAIACGFNAGDYQSDLVKKWMVYCETRIRQPGAESVGDQHGEYTQYYYAQVMYVLGEDRHAKLFPDVSSDRRLTWKKYRNWIGDELARTQQADGSWTMTNWTAMRGGAVYVTSIHLAILQLDRAALPIYQR